MCLIYISLNLKSPKKTKEYLTLWNLFIFKKIPRAKKLKN